MGPGLCALRYSNAFSSGEHSMLYTMARDAMVAFQKEVTEMNATVRKWMGFVVAAMLMGSIAVLAGCSSSGDSSSSGASGSSEAASSAVESSEAAASEAASSAEAGLANPWSDAASAEEAAQGAGLDAFPLPEGAIADLGEPIEVTYSYMEGMAQARYEFPASAVTVRTAALAEGDLFDISGDYNTYANEWTEYVDNVPVACAGNREGESTKTYWGEEDIAHSLLAEGLGGDDDFGLTPERLAVFVEAME